MKKAFLIILLAALTFVACNDDEIDYSSLTLEEIVATNGGWNYLTGHYGSYDYEQLVAMMGTGYFTVNFETYTLTEHGWEPQFVDGGIARHYAWLDAETMRGCFRLPFDLSTDFQNHYYHKDFTVNKDNWFDSVLDYTKNARVIGLYKDEAILFEYETFRGGDTERMICRIHKEGKEELFSLHAMTEEEVNQYRHY